MFDKANFEGLYLGVDVPFSIEVLLSTSQTSQLALFSLQLYSIENRQAILQASSATVD